VPSGSKVNRRVHATVERRRRSGATGRLGLSDRPEHGSGG